MLPLSAIGVSSGSGPGLLLPEFSTLASHAEAGNVAEVLAVFDSVESQWPEVQMGLLHDLVFKTHISAKNFSGAAVWFTQMRRRGVEPVRETFTQLLQLLARQGQLQAWLKAGESKGLRLDAPRAAAVVEAFAGAAQPRLAGRWLSWMAEQGWHPSPGLQRTVLRALGCVGEVKASEALMRSMASSGVELVVEDYNDVIAACARQGNSTQAVQWLQRLEHRSLEPNQQTINTIIDAFAEAGDNTGVEMWYKKLSHYGFEASAETFAALILGCVRASDYEGAERWQQEMGLRQLQPTLGCFNAMLEAQRFEAEAAQRTFDELSTAGLRPDRVSYDALVQAWANADEFKEAQRWLKRMTDLGYIPYVPGFRALIGACLRQHPPELGQALRYQRQLKESGQKPDLATYFLLLKCCAACRQQAVAKDSAKRLLYDMAREGFQANQEVEDVLVEIWGIGQAKQLMHDLNFPAMPSKAAKDVEGHEEEASGKTLQEEKERYLRQLGRRPNNKLRRKRRDKALSLSKAWKSMVRGGSVM